MVVRARRKQRLIFLSANLAISGLASSAFALSAFPGADGFGANALGGRGGAVYHVTDLTDNTASPDAGSFRGVLAQIAADEKKTTNPVTAATIVFDVGGTIPLTSNLDVKNLHNITIAGQTAPGPGITMVGYKFDVTSSSGTKSTDICSNIVIRYLADRRGNTISSADDDAMGVLGSTSDMNHNTHDVILDHVTAAWGMDEDLSVSDSATNVTISNSIISEALESGHQFGSLIRPRYGASVSYIGNLYANNRSRNPRPGTYNNSVLNFDFRNNTIYNWGDRAGYTGGATDVNTEYVNMNYTGNSVIAGPSTPNAPQNTAAFVVDTGSGVKDPLNVQVYQANNLVDLNRNSIADGTDIGWNAFIQYNGSTVSPFGSNQSSILTTVQETTPFGYPTAGSTTTDPTVAYQQTLASAGTTPWSRNESDARVINQAQTNGGAILLTAPTNEYNDLVNQAAVTRPAGFDTDQDGMPDAWEQARGLNPAVADNNAVVTSAESASLAGYTWLEMYLNDLTLQASWAGGNTGNWDAILNWSGQLPNLQDSTAALGNIGAAANITVNSSEHVGQLFFDNPAGYSLSGTGDITMDVLSKSGGTDAFATVTVASGNHTIAVPLNLLSDTHFTIAPGSLLDVTGALNAAGRNLSKDGGGDVQFGNIRAASLTITGGNVHIRQGTTPNSAGGISVLGSLGIAVGSQLDLTNNTLILPYATDTGSATTSAVRAMLQAGQITSSNATGSHRLGYGDNAILNNHNVGGLDPGTNSVLIEYTLAGDTDLNGSVNFTDLLTVAQNYGSTNSVWTSGDSNYDGSTNFTDLLALAQNYGQSLSILSAAQMAQLTQAGGPNFAWIWSQAQAQAAVPEPATFSLIGVAAFGLLRRRRSNKLQEVGK